MSGVGEGARRDTRRRLTVTQAADQLGVSVDAVRARIKRGTIAHVRTGGRVYVLLDADQDTAQDTAHADHAGRAYRQAEGRRHVDPLTEELRDRLRFVEGQLEAERQAHAEARRLLAAALERIPPQIEAPSEARESPTAATEQPGRVEPQPPLEGAEPRSWWRRVFGR